MKKEISDNQKSEILVTLKSRFENNKHRHEDILWNAVEVRLTAQPDKLWSLNEMEATGGEPDVIGYEKSSGTFLFCDCSTESPKGRRSLCYDMQAWESRKENKPKGSATSMATEMGIELLSEEQYMHLQLLGDFDNKTSSWILSPESVRKLGGALFGDFRYGRSFIYHNGAESYYAARGFRGILRV